MDDMLRDLAYEVQEALSGEMNESRTPILWNAEDSEVDGVGATPAVILFLEGGRKVRITIEAE